MRVVALLLVVASSSLAAEALSPMPLLAERWRSSTVAAAGWNALGFDATGWLPVTTDLPQGAPEWLTPEQQARHRFMWHPGGPNRLHPVYFRRSLFLDEKPVAATLRVCADDQFELFVNGRLVGAETEWQVSRDFDLTPLLRPGANVIALTATDVKPWGYGVLVVGEITQTWTEKSAWRSARKVTPRWTESGFDDSLWPPATLDRAPEIVAGEQTYSCFTTPTEIGDYGTAYFRRVLRLDGLPVAASVTILGDDSYALYVNGKLTAQEQRPELAYQPTTLDLGDRLHTGRNALAIKNTNIWGPARVYCVPTVTMAL